MQVIFQNEKHECGLACLAMISKYYKNCTTLGDLRKKFLLSSKGTTLTQLCNYAIELNFSCRAVRLDIEELSQLKLPCILHWNMDHYVVLIKYHRNKLTILDPALGKKKLSLKEISLYFTGVALEVTPNPVFEKKKFKSLIKLEDFFKYTKGLKKVLVILFVFTFAIELINLLTPQISQWIIDGAIISSDKQLLFIVIFSGSLLITLNFIFKMLQGLLALRLNQQLTIQWSTNLFNHLLKLPVTYFENRQLGDITSRFGSLDEIRNTLISGSITGVLDSLFIFTTLFMMFLYNSSLLVITIIFTLFYFVLRLIFYPALRNASEEKIILSSKEHSYFLETIQAIQPIKLFNGIFLRTNEWQNRIIDVQNRDIKTQKLLLLFSGLNTLIFGLENMLLLYYGSILVMNQILTIGMLVAFLAYKGQFTSRCSNLINLFFDIKFLSIHLDRLSDIVLEPTENSLGTEVDFSYFNPEIELKNVSFRYSPNDSWILKNISLKIKAYQSIVLVGSSGSGKSTLFKLIIGQLNPCEGEILIGGIPINTISKLSLDKIFSVVMQDDKLLTGSIYQNISFFNHEIKQENVEEASKIANIHKAITKMPMGYHTHIGEMGGNLSGGQRQRIVLARAFLKKPLILAMDEATSCLDIHNQHHIIKNLNQLNMTKLFITHRSECISLANRLIKLENGVITEDIMLK